MTSALERTSISLGVTRTLPSLALLRGSLSFLFILALQLGITTGILENIPSSLARKFTMDGLIPMQKFIVDDSNNGLGTHYKFFKEDVEEICKEASSILDAEVRGRSSWKSPQKNSKDYHFLQALQYVSLKGKRIINFGSTSPWYECLYLAAGARDVTTVDHNKLTFEHPRMHTVTVQELKLLQQRGKVEFDLAISLASFDHDGLGRYSDPVDPDADLKAMVWVSSLLSENGQVLLSVPVGLDLLVWNLHRRYGGLRLPFLLNGYNQVNCFGCRIGQLQESAHHLKRFEPVYLLRKPLLNCCTATECTCLNLGRDSLVHHLIEETNRARSTVLRNLESCQVF